jgi:hypothetical protein
MGEAKQLESSRLSPTSQLLLPLAYVIRLEDVVSKNLEEAERRDE